MNSAVLEDLCQTIGYTATRKLAVWFEGRRLLVPTAKYVLHPLRTLLGARAFEALVDDAGGMRFDIPAGAAEVSAKRDHYVAEALANGRSVAEIAEATGVTRREVEKTRRDLVDSGWLEYARGVDTTTKRWAVMAPPPKFFWEREGFSGDPPSPSNGVAIGTRRVGTTG